LFDTRDRLSWFNQLLNCKLNFCTLLTFPFLYAPMANSRFMTIAS